MIYLEGVKTTMDGTLAGRIVTDARLAMWTWNNTLGMHTLSRPTALCIDCHGVIMGQAFRRDSAIQAVIPDDVKSDEKYVNP